MIYNVDDAIKIQLHVNIIQWTKRTMSFRSPADIQMIHLYGGMMKIIAMGYILIYDLVWSSDIRYGILCIIKGVLFCVIFGCDELSSPFHSWSGKSVRHSGHHGLVMSDLGGSLCW